MTIFTEVKNEEYKTCFDIGTYRTRVEYKPKSSFSKFLYQLGNKNIPFLPAGAIDLIQIRAPGWKYNLISGKVTVFVDDRYTYSRQGKQYELNARQSEIFLKTIKSCRCR